MKFRKGFRPDGTPASGGYIDKYGYRILTGHQHHPLACHNGEIKEHRKVLYDLLGAGEHDCHLCGKVLDWAEMVVDHLDGDPLNNSPENLMPACRKCNWDRQNPLSSGNRDYCVRGHQFTDVNTYTYPDGRRSCRICRRNSRLKKKAA